MNLRVLGCSGGELGKHRTTSFLLDGRVAIDAGALTASLSLSQLARVDDVVLSHAHLDHVKDVPLMADLLAGARSRPVVVHASPGCARTLRDSLFNGQLWPDFTRLPPKRPVLEVRRFRPGRRFTVRDRYAITPIRVSHPVETVGLIVEDGGGAVAITGDTGPTEAFWAAVNETRRVRALLVETSFPNRLQAVADASGHLTPATLATELAKLERDGFPILVYHLKPPFAAEIRRELAALELRRLRVLRTGEELAV